MITLHCQREVTRIGTITDDIQLPLNGIPVFFLDFACMTLMKLFTFQNLCGECSTLRCLGELWCLNFQTQAAL